MKHCNLKSLRSTEIGLYGQGVLWAGLAALLAIRANLEWTDEEFVYGICVLLGIFSIWSLWAWKRISGYYCDLYSLLLISSIAFSAGHAILEIFGLNPHGILNGQHPQDVVRDCLILVVVCLMAFHTAALISAFMHSKREMNETTERAGIVVPLRQVGIIMVATSVLPACYVTYENFSTIAESGYVGLYLRADPTGFNAWYTILASFLLPGSLCLLAASRGHHAGVVLSWTLISLPAFVNLMAGWRNPAIQAFAALLWLHSAAIRPIRKSFITVALIFGTLSVPVLGAIRNDIITSASDKVSALQRAYEKIDMPLVMAVQEMGNTLGTIAYTVQLVPSSRPYDYGIGYLYALSTIMPNLFWDLHPADKRGLPSGWLTQEVSPEMVRAGYGLGYSFIAEAYLNFSWAGAPVLMAILGFAVSSFVLRAASQKCPLLFALEGVLITFTLFFPRAESMLVIRPLVWQGLIPFMIVSYLYRRKVRLPVSLRIGSSKK